MVKNPPAKQETRVQFLGQEYPLEKEMATHSSRLAREILYLSPPRNIKLKNYPLTRIPSYKQNIPGEALQHLDEGKQS